MAARLAIIERCIRSMPDVELSTIFEDDFTVRGWVTIQLDSMEKPLPFEFSIDITYPFKSHENESITFKNEKLLEYSHVMGSGVICIHTSHSPDLEEKLRIDFESLKAWIVKYYINKEADVHYEHLIAPECAVDDRYHAFVFTNCELPFVDHDFGYVNLYPLQEGIDKYRKITVTYLVKDFVSYDKTQRKCQWSNIYEAYKPNAIGFYCFSPEAPSEFRRFVVSQWPQLAHILPQPLLKQIHDFDQKMLRRKQHGLLPLFIGYRINETEVHWQVALLQIGKLPFRGIPEYANGRKTGKWISETIDEAIMWGISRNSSYDYFFGRGKFCDRLTGGKILIIGIGAVGSILARTLARCGCRNLHFIDYDRKEPENVCRSEYNFGNGIVDKVYELRSVVSEISPFANMSVVDNIYFEAITKALSGIKPAKSRLSSHLDEYDFVFDCSTDNDLLYVLDGLELKTALVSLSITNHARELVCGVYPNVYRFVNNQFGNVLDNDTSDLYNPVGCWSPTFRASYNDICLLVQMALKHINRILISERPLQAFVVQEDTDSGQLNIIQY